MCPACKLTQYAVAKGFARRGRQRGKGRAFFRNLLIFVVDSPDCLRAPTLNQVTSAATRSELTGAEGRVHAGAEIEAGAGGLGTVPSAFRGENLVEAVGGSWVSAEHINAVRAKGKHARWCCPCGNVAVVPDMLFEGAEWRVRPPWTIWDPRGT